MKDIPVLIPKDDDDQRRLEDLQREGKLASVDQPKMLTEPPGKGWRPIDTAPTDGKDAVEVFAPASEGLPHIICDVRYHPDAGYCIDELRQPTHWRPLIVPCQGCGVRVFWTGIYGDWCAQCKPRDLPIKTGFRFRQTSGSAASQGSDPAKRRFDR